MRRFLQEWWRRIVSGFVADVPDALAACEFDCRREECRQGEWESCPRRLEALEGEDGEKRRSA